MTEAEKDFLVLNFKYLIMEDYVEKSRRDSLNAEANRFLSLHAGTKYESYTRNYIRYELEPSNWGLALELFSGYGFFTDHLRENIPEYKDLGLKSTTTYSFGINLDYKLGKSKARINNTSPYSFWFLRLRYAYNQPQFSSRYDRFDGDFHYITLGIGGFGRGVKRVY